MLLKYVTVGNSIIVTEKHGPLQRGRKEKSKQWIWNFGEVLKGKEMDRTRTKICREAGI